MKTASTHKCPKGSFLFFLFFLLAFTSISHAQTVNKALDLNGIDGYADLGSVSPVGNFSTGLTIECWSKWRSFNNWSRLLDLGNGPGSDNILFANEAGSSNLRFEVYQENFTDGITSPVNMDADRWYHVAVTQTNTGLTTIYIDGVAVASGTVHQPFDVDRLNCYIGRSNWSGDSYFDGQIDEMRIWNLARTQAEIKQYMFTPVASNAAGLLAYYRCNEGSGSIVVNSCTNSGAVNATAAESLAWSASPIQYAGNALNVDGADDYVGIGAPLSSGSSYTKEAWVYVTKNTAVPNNVVSSNLSPLWIDGGNLKTGNNGPSPELIDPGIFPTNTWVHVAVTFDAATSILKLYRNGNLVGSTSSDFQYAGEDNYIGAWYNSETLSTESYLGGLIDEVRIWNTARSQSEIQATMNQELNPAAQPSLIAYYTFNQGSGSDDNTGMLTAIDQKGTYNGTLNNFALVGPSSNFVQQPNTLVTLPVTFTSFSAQLQGSSVLVKWSTAQEQNASGYIVQRSSDSRTWTNLTEVAASASDGGARNYSSLDPSPLSGKNLYRIQQRDLDGKTSYTKVVAVWMDNRVKPFSLQSNVVMNGVLQVQVNTPLQLSLYNSEGQKLWTKELGSGRQTIETGPATKGLYFLKSANVTEKILVQ